MTEKSIHKTGKVLCFEIAESHLEMFNFKRETGSSCVRLQLDNMEARRGDAVLGLRILHFALLYNRFNRLRAHHAFSSSEYKSCPAFRQSTA